MAELTLLPPNATALERSLDLLFAQIEDINVPLRDLWNPETCPSPLLPWLAWAYSVDEWGSEWGDAQKRQAIATSIDVHKHKGTIGAIQNALASIGVELSVMEWFNRVPKGDPYTFEVVINAREAPVSQLNMESIIRLVDATKNARSQLTKINTGSTTKSKMYIAAASVVGVEMEVLPAYDKTGLALMMEGAANGFKETEAAVDGLHHLLHTTLPLNNYW